MQKRAKQDGKQDGGGHVMLWGILTTSACSRPGVGVVDFTSHCAMFRSNRRNTAVSAPPSLVFTFEGISKSPTYKTGELT